ncbi:hypothetical protein [Luteibacter sp. E-22]|uniref:hypothetical protein n=1 Tax=Luteibacter sp. E-22 TaxID=3404050 RepID=UPI003CE81B71
MYFKTMNIQKGQEMRELNTHESELVSGGLLKVPGACAPANLMTGAGIGALGMGVPGLFAGGPVGGFAGAIFGGSLGALGVAVNCFVELRAANR